MTIELREYAAADRPQLIGLIRELQEFESDLFDRLKPPQELGGDYLDNILAECARHDGVILVAARDNDLLGFAAVLTAVTSAKDTDEIDYTYAYVSELVVTEAERGAGLGTRLLDKCEEIARGRDVKWLRISVLADNARAVRTYQKFGFRLLRHRMEKPLG